MYQIVGGAAHNLKLAGARARWEEEEVVVESPGLLRVRNMHLRARNASARQSVPRSPPRSPGERCKSTRCCSGSRAARVSATRGAVGQFSRFGAHLYQLHVSRFDPKVPRTCVATLLTPGRHARRGTPTTVHTVDRAGDAKAIRRFTYTVICILYYTV